MATDRVVTYQTSNPLDGRISVCAQCERQLTESGDWPRSPATGEEFATVSMGLHRGACSVHPRPNVRRTK